MTEEQKKNSIQAGAELLMWVMAMCLGGASVIGEMLEMARDLFRRKV